MEIAYLTDKGQVRPDNQDAVGVFSRPDGIFLALVADGVGGQPDGGKASRLALTSIAREFQTATLPDFESAQLWLRSAIRHANQALVAVDTKMASTLVGALTKSEWQRALIANLGDAKAFRQTRQHELKQLTIDHSFANDLWRAGEVTENDREQVPNGHSVTRYLGIDERAEVEFFVVPFEPEEVLFLTSDGLTKVLSPETLVASLQDHISLQKVAEHLIYQANLAGAPDNISVVLLKNSLEKGGL